MYIASLQREQPGVFLENLPQGIRGCCVHMISTHAMHGISVMTIPTLMVVMVAVVRIDEL